MPWSLNDYPSSLKNLDPIVRKKAIEIGNVMVDEGYAENRAIPIATKQAKEWYENAKRSEIQEFQKQAGPKQKSDNDYKSRPELMEKGEHIVPHDDGWAVQAKDAKQPSEVFDVKADAVDRGREVAKNKETAVIIHRKDGTIQDQTSYE